MCEDDGQAFRLFRPHHVVQPVQAGPQNAPVKEQQSPEAWFCVDAATLRSVARKERNASTSGLPMEEGCRTL